MKVEGVGQLKATLAEVVIVVLIVIFARVVVGTVELDKSFDWPMLVLPASILLIAGALRMIELGAAKGSHNDARADARGEH
jgi:di/tricarboxylate transporter